MGEGVWTYCKPLPEPRLKGVNTLLQINARIVDELARVVGPMTITRTFWDEGTRMVCVDEVPVREWMADAEGMVAECIDRLKEAGAPPFEDTE